MNKPQNNNLNKIKATKSPQWIRDIAAGAKLDKNNKKAKNFSAIHLHALGNPMKQKTKSTVVKNDTKNSLANKKDDIDKIKKIYKRLINNKKNKIGNIQAESELEKTIERDENEIMQKINKRFKN